jgi:IS30 family transposase
MGNYTQLSEVERKEIDRLLNIEKMSRRQIAAVLGRSVNTVAREIRLGRAEWEGRNLDGRIDDKGHRLYDGEHYYNWDKAEEQAQERQSRSHEWSKIDRCQALFLWIAYKIESGWKPDVIAGWLRQKYPQERKMWVSHETIYAWIYREQNAEYRQYLAKGNKPAKKRRGVKRRQTSGIKYPVSIDERAETANDRSEFGNYEADSICGRQGSVMVLNSMIERKSRKLFLKRLPDGTARETLNAMWEVLSALPAEARKSVTMDNGSEFAKHYLLRIGLKMPTYFCHPYSSWERGSNENHNGLVRRFIPKKIDLKDIAEKDVQETMDYWNQMPRKILGYRTPNEVWREEMSNLR